MLFAQLNHWLIFCKITAIEFNRCFCYDTTVRRNVVVTHRLDAALMEQYDEIIVLRNGMIQERGNFEVLMERKGFFYSLYTLSA